MAANHVPQGRFVTMVRRTRDVVRLGIRGGTYTDSLPLEHQLLSDLYTTRNALRAALSALAGEGILDRRAGVGTTVSAYRFPNQLTSIDGLRRSQDASSSLTYQVLGTEILPAPRPIADALGVDVGHQVALIERITEVDGLAVSLSVHWHGMLGEAHLKRLDLASADSLAQIEAMLGAPIVESLRTIEAVAADHDSARLLGVPVGSALLYIESLQRFEHGRPVAISFSRLRPDRVAVAARSQRDEMPG